VLSSLRTNRQRLDAQGTTPHPRQRARQRAIFVRFELARDFDRDMIGALIVGRFDQCQGTARLADSSDRRSRDIREVGMAFGDDEEAEATALTDAQVVLGLCPTGASLSRAGRKSPGGRASAKRARRSATSPAPGLEITLPRPCDIASQSGATILATYRVTPCPRFRHRGCPRQVWLQSRALQHPIQSSPPPLRSKRSGVLVSRPSRPRNSNGARIQPYPCASWSGLGGKIPRTHLAYSARGPRGARLRTWQLAPPRR
jgi:hypothetical protein